MRILSISVALAISAIIILYITLFSLFCSESDGNFIKRLGLATGIIYEVLGVLFLVSGVLLLRKIKKFFR